MKKLLLSTMLICISFACSVQAANIQVWHALDGFLEEQFQLLATEFQQLHPEHQVDLLRKGNYTETWEAGVQASQRGEGPDVLQIPEYATQASMAMEGTFCPIQELMKKYDGGFDPSRYIEVVRTFYSTEEGEVLSLPWNISTGILYYNKEAFARAGLDPNRPPRTFEELEEFGHRLVKAGYIGFTTAWPAGYHLEHLGSAHNTPFASRGNGYAGSGFPLLINAPLFVHHLSKLVEWQKSGLFQYSGRYGDVPEALFTSGKAAILLQGANRSGLLSRKASFEIGVGELPHWAAFTNQPYNPGCGGASFWVLRNRSDEVYEAVAAWFNFLSDPAIQARWHRVTGYLPITREAYELALASEAINPAAQIGLQTMFKRPITVNSVRARLDTISS